MEFFYRRLFLLIGVLLHCAIHPMLLKPVRSVGSKTTRGTSAALGQRGYLSPHEMQKTQRTIAQHPELQKFGLPQGFAVDQSEALAQVFNVSADSSSDLVKLIKDMFHRATPESDLLPTKSIFKVASFITPEIMGSLMGALETGELEKGAKNFSEDILTVWYGNEAVQAKLEDTGGLEYGTKFKEKIGEFFNLATQLSQKNKNILDSVLLAFLYKKINHFNKDEEFHDWMHFLASINQYIPVFSAQELEETHKKLLAPNDYKSWIDSKIFSLKLNVMPYSTTQYAEFLVQNLPLVISNIIESNKAASIYPPKVIQAEYGYKGQKKKGDCVETAIRDILLNLFYDFKSRSFNTEKYPLLPIDPDLKKYIEMTTVDNINTLPMGQLFMDLVSGRESQTNIAYVEKDYELRSSSQNILHVLNTLLGTHATSWPSLGKELTVLSENKIKVDMKDADQEGKVAITITNTLNNNTQQHIDLCIMRIHAYVSFPDREQLKYGRIDLKSLATLPNINPLLRSLFYLVRDIDIDLLASEAQEMSPLLYYSWPVRNDDEKSGVIHKLLRDYTHDKDAMQYAYSLFKSLNDQDMRLLRNIDLFKGYCQDKDMEFKNRTKQAVVSAVGLLHLNTFLQEMTIEKAQQLMSSFMSIKDFDRVLLSNSNTVETILLSKEGDKLLLYILKKKLLREDESGYYRELVIEKLMNDLRDRSFITKFYSLHSRWLSNLLDILIADVITILSVDTDDMYYKESVCSLLLKQNIDKNDETLYNLFYTSLLPLYISLLEKNYFKYIQELGDIRLRLKKGSDIYQMYDSKMSALQQKAVVLKE